MSLTITVNYTILCTHSNKHEDLSMDHSVEITRDAYRALVDATVANASVEETELAHKIYYNVKGMRVLVLLNYIGGIEQYYIQDINA